MNDRILYAGDTHLRGPAAYLAGVLSRAGLPFDYVPSDAPLRPTLEKTEPRLYVLSDYPVKQLAEADFRRIIADIEAGAGLLMIGGWDSFHGAAGEYHESPLAEVLPVRMRSSDDRVNASQPCLVEKRAEHPILDGLPLDHPPGIGGYNRVRARDDAEVLLSARHIAVEAARRDESAEPDYVVTAGEAAPLLVVGRHGAGRTAAFTSDVAPHWVGGLVDWGPERVRARAPGA
ncbi:MAG: glutamine amidotransferase, partial [Longimicrobiales bacterium]